MADGLYVRYNGAWVNLAQIHLIGGSDYHPTIWNDYGVYDRFYIDFKEPLLPFPLSAFNKCIAIYGETQLTPIRVIKTANPSIYEVQTDISGAFRGVLVANYRKGLYLATGADLPIFSERFYVAGIPFVIDFGNIYDSAELYTDRFYENITEDVLIEANALIEIPAVYESLDMVRPIVSSVTEDVTVTLT